jgi:hypothetical protein
MQDLKQNAHFVKTTAECHDGFQQPARFKTFAGIQRGNQFLLILPKTASGSL